MDVPLRRKVGLWIFHRLLWDPPATSRGGPRDAAWAMRKILTALAVATWLTWREWVEHHPPEIAIVAVMHFLSVFGLIALLVYSAQRFRRGDTDDRKPNR